MSRLNMESGISGWMQLVILIFYMTGARNQLPLYNHILILVAAYLFLTGYGHFMYIWFRSEAGVVRLLQVLFVMNYMEVLYIHFTIR